MKNKEDYITEGKNKYGTWIHLMREEHKTYEEALSMALEYQKSSDLGWVEYRVVKRTYSVVRVIDGAIQ